MANVDLLKDLLEAVLGFPISAVEIVNPFNDKDTADDKLSILDLEAADAAGRRFDVEMQIFPHEALVPRLLYYWTKLYAGKIEAGDGFEELTPAYAVCFVNGRLFRRKPDVYLNHFEAYDRKTEEVMTDQFNIHIVELPKFTKEEREIATPLEAWCYFFIHGASLDLDQLPATLDRPPIRKAMEVLMEMSLDAQERERYESRLKFRRDMDQHRLDLQRAQAAAEANAASAAAAQAKAIAVQANATAQVAAAQAVAVAAQATAVAAQARAAEGFVGQINLCQRLLKQPPTPKEELASKSLDDLQRLADELRRRIDPGT